ncbi:hypothetical protein E2C01_095738 [Portunus trituberculatus]|uniref:Uncharacterized protein n=1 Tax=Portunus trituberculatus TaxID=210409 RepID=A0A5B7K147_PORTR|nr:hypothetical protein [Portunus trituberculatus]
MYDNKCIKNSCLFHLLKPPGIDKKLIDLTCVMVFIKREAALPLRPLHPKFITTTTTLAPHSLLASQHHDLHRNGSHRKVVVGGAGQGGLGSAGVG